MNITRDADGRLQLKVNEEEATCIFYCLGFCEGGIPSETENVAIQLEGVYNSFMEYEDLAEQIKGEVK
jgi:hypothetical protein